MKTRNSNIWILARGTLLVAALLTLTACGNNSLPGEDVGQLAPQATGKFSSGSLFSGSVLGDFTLVGLGNVAKTPYVVEMQVQGVLWFSCVNNGGNDAPGQLQFDTSDDSPATFEDPLNPDRNGRFIANNSVDPMPTDEACTRNNNWRVKVDESATPITYIQPTAVLVFLFEVDASGAKLDPENPIDFLEWTCDAPDPTYPLEAYDAPPLEGEGGVCTVVVGV